MPPGKRVMPLTVMTITDLENLEFSVDQFGMRQLLADYAVAHPDALVSLHNFMAVDPRYADKLKPSAQLMGISERLIRLAHSELFPELPNLDPEHVRARRASRRPDIRAEGREWRVHRGVFGAPGAWQR